jgi:hypothetical protein
MPTTLEINAENLPVSGLDGYSIGIVAGAGKLFDTRRWSRRRVYAFAAIADTAYNLAAADEGKYVIHTNASASTITILNDTSLTWEIGGSVEIQRAGTGTLTIAAGSGVTLTTAGRAKLRVQGSVARLIKTAANAWTLEGDTTA